MSPRMKAKTRMCSGIDLKRCHDEIITPEVEHSRNVTVIELPPRSPTCPTLTR